MKSALIGKRLIEIENIIQVLNGRKENAISIAKWLYRSDKHNFDTIESIPLVLRKSIDSVYSNGKYSPSRVTESRDDTRKYLFINDQGLRFESAYMPGQKRNTLCISTQVGCRMGCRFCLTGKMGFKGNLSAKDILNQYLSIPERNNVNRIVIMGMGEPFDNFDEVMKAIEILTAEWGMAFGASNITLSTVGLLEPLKEFLENPLCNLAISLNNPFSDERKEFMPIESTNPIAITVNHIKEKPLRKPLRLSFEYVALGGKNLSERHAIAIAKLLEGIKCHLNIIGWNSHPKSSYNSPEELELNDFINCLNKNGVLTAVRQSRGQDIGAACGQMASKEVEK